MSWLQSVTKESHEVAIASLGSIVALWVMFKKISRQTADDNKAIARDDATSSIITMMQQEIERLSKQNADLATRVNQLQLEVIQLRGQLNASQTNSNNAQRR